MRLFSRKKKLEYDENGRPLGGNWVPVAYPGGPRLNLDGVPQTSLAAAVERSRQVRQAGRADRTRRSGMGGVPMGVWGGFAQGGFGMGRGVMMGAGMDMPGRGGFGMGMIGPGGFGVEQGMGIGRGVGGFRGGIGGAGTFPGVGRGGPFGGPEGVPMVFPGNQTVATGSAMGFGGGPMGFGGAAAGFGGAPMGFGGFGTGGRGAAPATFGGGRGGFGTMGGRGGFGGGSTKGGGGSREGALNHATQAGSAWGGTAANNNGDPFGWQTGVVPNSGHGGNDAADPLAGWGEENVMGNANSRGASQSTAAAQSAARSLANTTGNRSQRPVAPSNSVPPASTSRSVSRPSTNTPAGGSSRTAASTSSGADKRIPPPGTPVSSPIVLRDSSGKVIHQFFWTLKNPAPGMRDKAAGARKKGKEKKARIKDMTAAEIALHAMIQKKTLKEVSTGLRGTIFVIEKDEQEVLGALMELGTWRGGRWEFLGIGTDKDDGRLFVLKIPT